MAIRALWVLALLLCIELCIAAGASGEELSLLDAAKAGRRDVLQDLIRKKADVNESDGDGSTALHWASYRNDAEAVEMLLKAGAKVNAATDLGVTPLWVASENGSEAIVRRLLQAGADPNIALASGETPLMVAARGGYAGVAGQLAAKGASVDARGARGQTALMWAASRKHPEVTKVLLAYKPDLHAKSDTYSEMMAVAPHSFPDYNRLIPHGAETALMFAARVGDLESAKLLVAAGANVNDADAWGVSAATLAAHSNFGELAIYLLDRGADPDAAMAGMSAMHNAIMHRNEAVVKSLLDHGANPNLQLKTWTPSRRTSKDLNYAPELVGASPLWLAARYTSPGIMKMLIDRGADPRFVHRGDYVPESGMTRDGVFQHRSHVTTVLMAAMAMGGGDAWAPVDASEKEALTLAAAKLAAIPGVDVNLANTDGKTALDAAKTLKYESVVEFLTALGAKPGAPPPAPAPAR